MTTNAIFFLFAFWLYMSFPLSHALSRFLRHKSESTHDMSDFWSLVPFLFIVSIFDFFFFFSNRVARHCHRKQDIVMFHHPRSFVFAALFPQIQIDIPPSPWNNKPTVARKMFLACRTQICVPVFITLPPFAVLRKKKTLYYQQSTYVCVEIQR